MLPHYTFNLTDPTSAPSPEPAAARTGSVQFIGTATTLIRVGEFTVLTDPNFIHRHEQVDLGYGLKATRQTDPAVDIAGLPPIDLIVLSHFHGDHFDQVAEAELDKNILIITPAEAAQELALRGFANPYALPTWKTAEVKKNGSRLWITAAPGRHGPPMVSFALPEVMGSVLDFAGPDGERQARIYISGDTLVMEDIQEIPRRYPDIDLALLHLGGTVVLGILVTMDAEQGLEMLQIISPQVAIPIHYNDYDVFKSPLEDFQRLVREAGLESKVRYLSHGETYNFPLGGCMVMP